MKTRFLLAALVFLSAFAITAEAQRRRQVYLGTSRGYGWGRWYTNPWYYGYGYGQVQTPYGAALSGQADVIRARAEAAESRAKAAASYEVARKQYLENKTQWHAIVQERKRAKAAKAEREKAERRAKGAEWKKKRGPKQLPPRLAEDQLDRSTGTLEWPEELTGKQFEDDRKQVEQLLKVLSSGAGDEGTADALEDVAKEMRTAMSKQAKELGFSRYSALRKFLNSLGAEGKHALAQ